MTSLEKLAREIRDNASKATQGDWIADEIAGNDVWIGPSINESVCCVFGGQFRKLGEQKKANAAHIALCSPARILALMDVVLAYEKALRLYSGIPGHDCAGNITQYSSVDEALAYAEQRLRDV